MGYAYYIDTLGKTSKQAREEATHVSGNPELSDQELTDRWLLTFREMSGEGH
jgi:hypothetical protein